MSDDADESRRKGVAEEVQDKNVESKGTGTHRRVSHVGKDGVGRTRIEKQAKTGQEKKYPGPGKGRAQNQKKQREAQEHRRTRHQEIGAWKAAAKPISGPAAQKRRDQ